MRKGEIAKDVVYWLLYVPLTFIVIVVLASVAASVMDTAVDTHGLNARIWSARVHDAVSYRDPLTHRLYPGEIRAGTLGSIDGAFRTAGSLRHIGVRAVLADRAGGEAYHDKGFYDDARPLAPVRYALFAETWPVLVRDETPRWSRLEVEQVYSTAGEGGFR